MLKSVIVIWVMKAAYTIRQSITTAWIVNSFEAKIKTYGVPKNFPEIMHDNGVPTTSIVNYTNGSSGITMYIYFAIRPCMRPA